MSQHLSTPGQSSTGRFYEEHPEAVYRFRGRSAVKRENTPAWACGCKPYRDIFTVGRWNALGHAVARGQHCEPEHRAGKTLNIPVFCRCQLVGADAPHTFTGDPDYIPGFDSEPVSNFEYSLMQESGRESERGW